MGSHIFEYAEKVILPLLGFLAKWIFDRYKRRKEGNSFVRDTVEVNEGLIGANDRILEKVGELQRVILGIKEESAGLKDRILVLEQSLEFYKAENRRLKGLLK